MAGEATREVTRQDRIYCLKASSDYHRELCEECRFYPNCDHVTQDDMTELTIKDLEALEQEPTIKNDIRYNRVKNELNRVKDELEPTTKNNLRVDWESYKDVDGNSLDDLILEVLQNNFDCGNTYGYKVADEIIGLLPSVTPQEQDKPMVEIDLYSVIKQKYIEGEVLDKIRAEIMQLDYDIEFIDYDYNDMAQTEEVHTIYREEVLQILDKYKAESEVQ